MRRAGFPQRIISDEVRLMACFSFFFLNSVTCLVSFFRLISPGTNWHTAQCANELFCHFTQQTVRAHGVCYVQVSNHKPKITQPPNNWCIGEVCQALVFVFLWWAEHPRCSLQHWLVYEIRKPFRQLLLLRESFTIISFPYLLNVFVVYMCKQGSTKEDLVITKYQTSILLW